ncbi:CASR protein, partial [Polypterus senegalus]
MMQISILFMALLTRAQEPSCRSLSKSVLPVFSKDGDIIIGGIFSFHNNVIGLKPAFTSKPEPLKCKDLNLMEFQFAQTMVFAIEEINNNTALLPDLSLGYKIYGDCSSVNLAMAAVMALVNDENEEIVSGSNCKKSSTIYALIGLSESPLSISVATFLSPFRIPMVSYFATCACLSNRNEYPTFFRTIPSDYHQSKALAKLVKQFGWTWIGVIRSDNDYGIYGTATFIEAVQMEGVCIEYTAAISRYNPLEQYHETVNIIKQSTSKVIVAFTSFIDLEILIQEIALQNITGLQWIGSEAWISNAKLTANEMYRILGGALGFAITNAVIPGLKEFLSNIHPSDTPANSVMDEFWENIFNYTFTSQNANDTNKLYEAAKQLSDINNQYTDVSDLRIAKNIYKGMYAIAHALHDMSICPTAERTQNECTDIWKTRPWQISYYATCACLSNKQEFPTFFRTIPSDFYQSRALAQLVKHFGWTWIGAIRSDSDYGNAGMTTFLQDVQQQDVCIEYSEAIARASPREKILRLVNIIKSSTSKVIVAFASFIDLEFLIQELSLQNVTGLQWVGSEGWISNEYLAISENYKVLGGSIGCVINNAVIPGLQEFLENITVFDIPESMQQPVTTVQQPPGSPEIPISSKSTPDNDTVVTPTTETGKPVNVKTPQPMVSLRPRRALVKPRRYKDI